MISCDRPDLLGFAVFSRCPLHRPGSGLLEQLFGRNLQWWNLWFLFSESGQHGVWNLHRRCRLSRHFHPGNRFKRRCRHHSRSLHALRGSGSGTIIVRLVRQWPCFAGFVPPSALPLRTSDGFVSGESLRKFSKNVLRHVLLILSMKRRTG